jgi:NAD-dependent deacetylase
MRGDAFSGLPPETLARLREARSIAVLTGAGISAESGIPTFRDALTGLWAQYRAEDLATPEAFHRDPALVWAWYRWRRELVARAEPNAGHRALARLATLVPSMTLITQNVDGLHRRAGSGDVVELHGSILRARCSAEDVVVEHWQEVETGPPPCGGCGAPLRPDVVWFGEQLPRHALERAWSAASACDAFLSVGTSNLVEPAASLPWAAARAGAMVVVVNTTAEGQRRGDGIFHLVGRAGDVLPGLVDAVWGEPDRGDNEVVSDR